MKRETLLDFFEDFATLDDPFVVHDDGYKVRTATYREIAEAARRFAADLAAKGVSTDDKLVIWSENRAEWLVALWGCLLARVVLVPVDFRASVDLVRRIVGIVGAKAVLVGHEVERSGDLGTAIWPIEEIPIGRSAVATTTTPPSGLRPTPTTLAEIIFTSGATAEPKGVTLTHRNLLANIIPIEREVRKYRRYERPFHPIRFLNLLPLSHMFGQSMATFVPPMFAGTVVFSHGYSPVEIVRQIKTRRISVLVVVPKVLDVLREHVQRVHPETAAPDTLEGRHWAWRWWHYRRVHRMFGWKFWCIVCGAAALDPELEAFWRKLGFLVVQGYGLTETAPVVTLNHPFRASRGSVGKPIAGVDVQIADDGEILVRGDNVTAGYYNAGGKGSVEAEAFKDGWFHTGDIGELDADGRLVIKGRKKEMIVTAQGLNVFPEDVERALMSQPGVIDAGVVGVSADGEERVHAVLVLAPDARTEDAVRGANATLEDHQRVWSTSVWPGEALPRTEGTQKLKRRELRRWVESGQTASAAAGAGHTLEDVVSRFASGRTLTDDTTLDELGLSSLDRVELLMALEDAFQVTLDEAAMAEAPTIGHLRALIAPEEYKGGGQRTDVAAAAVESRAAEPIRFPSWNRSWPSWFIRRISLPTWILPLGRVFMQISVQGPEHLAKIEGPVIFAANHQSHMDTPAILIALPPKWRYRVAPAMAKEFFKAHFNPRDYSRKAWFTNSLNYYLACQFFNAFPLPQREAGTRQTLRYVGEITGDGYSILIFPEGRRTENAISPFRPGVAMMSARLDVPVVPVRIEGLDRVLHPKWKWPKRGPVRVAFGEPMRLSGENYPEMAQEIQKRIEAL
ncbi:MAG TPA: AMP-binding protein [Vicinamibacterales bacterium]|nr:AMP-binding protein [Vicinamibacterales bacterium]